LNDRFYRRLDELYHCHKVLESWKKQFKDLFINFRDLIRQFMETSICMSSPLRQASG